MTTDMHKDTVDLLKTRAADITEQCHERGVLLSEVKEIYKKHGFETAMSWARLIRKLMERDITISFSLERMISDLQKTIERSILFHDKAVRIYLMAPQEVEELYKALSEIDENFRKDKTYTYKSLNYDRSFESDDMTYFLFRTIRTFVEKVSIHPSEFESEQTREHLQEFDEVVGLKKVTRTCFDAVCLAKEKGAIVISIDMASRLRLEDVHKAAALVLRALNDLLRSRSVGIHLPDNGINLFYCIRNFYLERSGEITEIAFSTDDGSTHYEKVGAKVKDIRKNLFHESGAEKVPITPYKIGKKYSISSDGEVAEVFMPGSYRALSLPAGPTVFDAIFRHCESAPSFSYLISRLIDLRSALNP